MMAAAAPVVAVVVDRPVVAGTDLGRRVRRQFTEEAAGQEGVAGIGRAETLDGTVISMAATSGAVVAAGVAPACGTVTISAGGIIVISASLCLPLVTDKATRAFLTQCLRSQTPSGAMTRAGGAARGGMTTASTESP